MIDPMLLVLAALALSNGPPERAPATAPPGVPEPFFSECKEACIRSRQMQAIGADMIARQCAERCEGDWRLPECSDEASVPKLAGQPARVIGRLERIGERRPPGGPKGEAELAIAFKGGARIKLTGGAGFDPKLAATLEGRRVVAVGTLAVGAGGAAQKGTGRVIADLEMITVLVPLDSSKN